jgi:protein-S-isoprenylcysteine O-methyltransferase Ste14
MDLLANLLRWLVWISLIGWVVFYWRGGSKIASDIWAVLRAPVTRLDAILLIAMSGGTLLLLAIGGLVNFGVTPIDPAIAWWALPGAVLTLAGIAGTFYCRHYLGRAWTARTRVGAEQSITESGPYGVVRHPIYTAAIVLYGGLGLVFPLGGGVLAAGLIVVAYVLKTRDEDLYLQANFKGYSEYTRRVRYCLLPKVW